MKQRWKLDQITSWLSRRATPANPDQDQQYRHQLLREVFEIRPQIIEKLRLLVWRAHEDARLYRRGESADFCIPGKPPSVPDNPVEWQPELLPLKTQKEYFGEILAGLVVENYAPFGIEDWVVPVFFFRFHNTAYHRLEQISDTGEEAKEVPGVLGNDGLAFYLGADGHIKRSLVYEAKCTAEHRSGMIAKAHEQLSDSRQIPESIWQVVEIIRDRKYDDDMLNALLTLGSQGGHMDYERCDLVAYVHGQLPKKNPTWIDPKRPHSDYSASRRLEAVEIYIRGVCEESERNLLNELAQDVHLEIQVDEMEYEVQKTGPVSDQVEDLIQRLLEERAESFPPRYAKLYSQHKRLRAGQQGLASWRPNEASERLSESVQLLEFAFIARETDKHNWQEGMQRAGAILEWLAHPELDPSSLPLQLLSAAAYQLGGYPACAVGLLRQEPLDKTESRVLRALLEADFPKLLRRLTEYWATEISPTEQVVVDSLEGNLENFEEWVVSETTRALGVLCAEMRWGDEERLSSALDKLLKVSKMMLHGRDVYSWLLSKLCAEAVTVYVQSSFRSHLSPIASRLSHFGEKALENYMRLCYQQKKALAWPSQVRGIQRLKDEESFALCTPTGSGKTTVAEVAILQSLFEKQTVGEDKWIPPEPPAPLAIYLTPTRALSAEVESTLSRTLGNLGSKEVVVTGLYGGTDWGPTDAWLTEKNPTVLICTYEKAEALMRFLGSWFRDRISLVIIDEAHRVNFDKKWSSLQKAENRALRLESIGTRILTYLDETESRIMALSAVASGIDDALDQWVSNRTKAEPERASYRSTRQLIGRLECLRDGKFKIFYDLMDGDDLEFEEGVDGKPFVPTPLPLLPSTTSDWSSTQKQYRPYLFWAAMHLAQRDESGQQHAVLISITQRIGGYAEDFLTLLESDWKEVKIPDFFVTPDARSPEYDIWQDCLKACEDYFTDQSREYRLLKQGVIVHHGKMPGPLARLLVEAIEAGIIHLVLATSTLTEGVNLPFETVLIPNLRRYDVEKNIG